MTLFPRLRERTQPAGRHAVRRRAADARDRPGADVASRALLLLDEPSLGLAPILVQQIFEIIKEINDQGTTILLVEQNALQALTVAHRGYVLQTGDGRPVGPGVRPHRERDGPEGLPRRDLIAMVPASRSVA